MNLAHNSTQLLSFLTMIEPSAGSTNLNKARVSDDLPAPVLPTIPTFCPPSISKETLFKTRSRPSLKTEKKLLTNTQPSNRTFWCLPISILIGKVFGSEAMINRTEIAILVEMNINTD